MARLQTLKARISSAPARLATMQPGSWRTDKTSNTARGYGYKRQQARAGYLVLHPFCAYCLREVDTVFKITVLTADTYSINGLDTSDKLQDLVAVGTSCVLSYRNGTTSFRTIALTAGATPAAGAEVANATVGQGAVLVASSTVIMVVSRPIFRSGLLR